jgi:hypothetical protein
MGSKFSNVQPIQSGIKDVLLDHVQEYIIKLSPITRIVISVVVDLLATISMVTVVLNTLYRESIPIGYIGRYLEFSRKIPTELYILFSFLVLPFQTQLFSNGVLYIALGLISIFCGFYGSIGWPLWISGAIITMFGLLTTGLVSEDKLKFLLGIFEYTSVVVIGIMLFSLFLSYSSGSVNQPILALNNSKGDYDTANKLFLN